MRYLDIIRLCFNSLSRQKARTMLTVLGVIIGSCSILLMLSFGIGSSEQSKVLLSNMGDLSVISVYSYGSSEKDAMNDDTISSIEEIPNVELVTPKLSDYNYNFQIYAGANNRYKMEYAPLTVMNYTAPEKLNYDLKEGSYIDNDDATAGSRPIPVLVGEKFFYSFVDTKRPEQMNMRHFTDPNANYDSYDYSESPNNSNNDNEKPFEEPFISGLNTKLYLDVTPQSDNPDKVPKPFRQELKIVGIMKENYSKGPETSAGVIMGLKPYFSIIKKVNDINSIPKQNQKKVTYNELTVKVNDLKNVKEVEKQIKAMKLATSSMESVRESVTKEAHQKQMMLAGVGAISLVVAAIGIMNTMIMSITERTKEIGIMKALGCDVSDIRKIFLTEAAFIGFLGGLIGSIISVILSFLINVAGAIGLISSSNAVTDFVGDTAGESMGFFEKLSSLQIDWGEVFTNLSKAGGRMSIIPFWLIILGLLFSTIIGIISGYYPSNKAVKIPALEAIKHD